MAIELLWLLLGVMASLVAGAGAWIICLIAKTRHQKQQLCGLMHDKGALSMRVSILEDTHEDKVKELKK